MGDLLPKFPGSAAPAQFDKQFHVTIYFQDCQADGTESLNTVSLSSSSLVVFQVIQNTLQINTRFEKVALNKNSGEKLFTNKNLVYVKVLRRNFRKKAETTLFQNY